MVKQLESHRICLWAQVSVGALVHIFPKTQIDAITLLFILLFLTIYAQKKNNCFLPISQTFYLLFIWFFHTPNNFWMVFHHFFYYFMKSHISARDWRAKIQSFNIDVDHNWEPQNKTGHILFRAEIKRISRPNRHRHLH